MPTDVDSGAQAFLRVTLQRLNLTLSEWEAFQNGSVSILPTTGITEDSSGSSSAELCGQGVRWVRDSYRPVHGYLALLVCIFGSLANLTNIAVLTRKDMVSSTNAILTGLAVADLAVMIEYIPFAFQSYIMVDEHTSYPVTVYVLFHAHFAQVFHTASIFLTVMLAVWRFLSVVHPQTAVSCCTLSRSVIGMVASYLISPLICVPSFLAFTILSKPSKRADGGLVYSIGFSEAALAHGRILSRVNFWLYSVLIKLTPCIALTYFSVRLIRALLETKRRKDRLMSGARQLQPDHRLLKWQRQTDRTTRMLIAVLLLFLITEFPQGILGLLSGALQVTGASINGSLN